MPWHGSQIRAFILGMEESEEPLRAETILVRDASGAVIWNWTIDKKSCRTNCGSRWWQVLMVGTKQQNGEMQCVVSCLKLPGLEDGRHDDSFFKGLKGLILGFRRDHWNYRMINLTCRPDKTKENVIWNLILRLVVYWQPWACVLF